MCWRSEDNLRSQFYPSTVCFGDRSQAYVARAILLSRLCSPRATVGLADGLGRGMWPPEMPFVSAVDLAPGNSGPGWKEVQGLQPGVPSAQGFQGDTIPDSPRGAQLGNTSSAL